jgi:hypothetical protein
MKHPTVEDLGKHLIWIAYLLLVASFLIAVAVSGHHLLKLCDDMSTKTLQEHCEDSLRSHDRGMQALALLLFAGCNAFSYKIGLMRQSGDRPGRPRLLGDT